MYKILSIYMYIYKVFNILRNVNNYIRCTCVVVAVAAVVVADPATLVQGI